MLAIDRVGQAHTFTLPNLYGTAMNYELAFFMLFWNKILAFTHSRSYGCFFARSGDEIKKYLRTLVCYTILNAEESPTYSVGK
jgi:hypothetical protein